MGLWTEKRIKAYLSDMSPRYRDVLSQDCLESAWSAETSLLSVTSYRRSQGPHPERCHPPQALADLQGSSARYVSWFRLVFATYKTALSMRTLYTAAKRPYMGLGAIVSSQDKRLHFFKIPSFDNVPAKRKGSCCCSDQSPAYDLFPFAVGVCLITFHMCMVCFEFDHDDEWPLCRKASGAENILKPSSSSDDWP